MISICVLVGTNPIPCYISSVYLLNYFAAKKLFLICSAENKGIKQSGTYKIGKNIERQLRLKHSDLQIELKEILDVNSDKAISTELEDILNSSDEIHLNYTGGTKSMAAITYSLLSKAQGFSSSYLDGRRHIMILDGDPALCDYHDLRNDPELVLDLQSVTNLHNLPTTAIEQSFDQYSCLLDELKKLLFSGELSHIYGASQSSSQKKKLKTCSEDEKRMKEEEEKNSIIRYKETIITKSRIRDLENDESRIDKYIEGLWLEHYLFLELNKNVDDIKIYTDVNKANHFQIDIIAIHGYQMTLISVTTDDTNDLCKLKAFEAIARAHQLGGDEAKTVLVSLNKAPSTLERNLEGSYGSTVPGFKAFGIEDITNSTVFENLLKYIKE